MQITTMPAGDCMKSTKDRNGNMDVNPPFITTNVMPPQPYPTALSQRRVRQARSQYTFAFQLL